MNQKLDFAQLDQSRIVYIRPIDRSALPAEMQENLPENAHAVSVHDANGQQLALVADRNLAFVLARQHNMAPVSVH